MYEISLASPNDIPGILALQEPNLIERGGGLTVRHTAHWFGHAISDKSVFVARREDKVIGYVLGTSLAENANIPIIQSMLRTFPAPPDCYSMVQCAWLTPNAARASRAPCSRSCVRTWATAPP
jgi:hypothetical protein